MAVASTVADQLRLKGKLQIRGRMVFQTAWRIGTGREGETGSDLGVMLDPSGRPVLPGSSLKGRLRQTCESLAPALGLTACLLRVEASAVRCVSDVDHYTKLRKAHQDAIKNGVTDQLEWIKDNTCDVCKLFGSPVRAGRLQCSDGQLVNEAAAAVRVRDGVVLDRDSHTAVKGLKYDYETVAAGTAFDVRFDLDNPTGVDESLVGAALFEWHGGSSLGGFTSRGLGRFVLNDIQVSGVNLDDAKERVQYLTAKPDNKLADRGEWQTYFTEKITETLDATGGA